MIYEYFRGTGAHEAVLGYSDLFRITLHGDVQEFDTRWDEVLLSIRQCEIRKRGSDELKTGFGIVRLRN